MTTYTSHYPPEQTTAYVKATTYYSGSYAPWLATDPSKPLTGVDAGNVWVTTDSAVPQKFNIDHGAAFIAARVYVENYHASGTVPEYGLKTIRVYGTNSATAFANTDAADLTDLTLLGEFICVAHVGSDVADPQYFLITGNTTAYRYTVIVVVDRLDVSKTRIGVRRIEIQSGAGAVRAVLDQPYDLQALIIRNAIEQIYSLALFLRPFFDQVYGIKLAAFFAQYYGDTPIVHQRLDQYYGDAAAVRRAVVQMYGDATAICALIEQPYSLPGHLTAFIEQKYAISGAALQQVVEQLWALKGTDAVRAILEQPFGILADPGRLLTYTAIVSAGGAAIDPLHINIEGSQDQFCLSCEIHCPDQAAYLACAVGVDLTIVINGESFAFFVESRERRRGHGTAEYVVRGLSKSARLDAPYADTISGELTGMASAVVAALAPGFVIHWQTVDWFIPANTLLPADQTPLAVIRDIAHAAGAIVQTGPDGSITIEPLYRVAVDKWAAAAVNAQLADSRDFFSTSETFEHRPGYNKFLVSDQLTTQTTLRLDEEEVSATVKLLRAYQTPWADDFSLRHSGGAWVTIEALGLEEIAKTETVEFVNGEGRTQFPIYEVSTLSWLQANLGSVTHGEDGRLVAAVAGESLLAITYQTRCRQWRVTNPRAEKVQFIIDEVAA